MENFPHQYLITASGKNTGAVVTDSRQCPPLFVAEPKEFDGTGEHWSPEQMFVAIVANCLILTFRAIASASNFNWVDIECNAQGTLERVDRVNKFTQINLKVTLILDSEADESKGLRLLTKAENQCLIKNSISAETIFLNKVRLHKS